MAGHLHTMKTLCTIKGDAPQPEMNIPTVKQDTIALSLNAIIFFGPDSTSTPPAVNE
jgi:hypothetical protein